MAVLRVKNYHTGKAVSNSLAYANDLNKTIAPEISENAIDDEIINALNYSQNMDKTRFGENEKEILISGHNCNYKLAYEVFKQSRENYYNKGHKENLSQAKVKKLLRVKADVNGKYLYDKNGNLIPDDKGIVYKDPDTGKAVYIESIHEKQARLGYMWVMSFPGEKELGYKISPQTIHEIGMRFCREYLGDYAATISTHMNTDHCHNHIVSCAYALDGSHKYRDTMDALKKARKLCDDLSIEYDIPIILQPGEGKSISREEWDKINQGCSWKQMMRDDIKLAASLAKNFDEYKDLIQEAGYTIRETRSHLTYRLKNEGTGKEYACRDNKLLISSDPFDYTKEGIIKYLDGIDIEYEIFNKKVEQELEDIARRQANEKLKKIIKVIRISPHEMHIQRYNLDEKRRSLLVQFLVEILKVITILIEVLKIALSHENDIQSRQNLNSLEEKAAAIERSLDTLENHDIMTEEDLSRAINQKGIEISIHKKEVSNLQKEAEELKSLLKKMDEIQLCMEAVTAESGGRGEEEIRYIDERLQSLTKELKAHGIDITQLENARLNIQRKIRHFEQKRAQLKKLGMEYRDLKKAEYVITQAKGKNFLDGYDIDEIRKTLDQTNQNMQISDKTSLDHDNSKKIEDENKKMTRKRRRKMKIS